MQDLLTPPEPKIQPEQVVKPVIEVGVQAITEPAAVKQDKNITKKNLEEPPRTAENYQEPPRNTLNH